MLHQLKNKIRTGYSFLIIVGILFILSPPLEQQTPEILNSHSYKVGMKIPISLPVSPDYHRYHSSLAYDHEHGEFLVVWQQNYASGVRQIYARWLNGSGQPISSPFQLNPDLPNRQIIPDVVYNATDDEYLVVFMYNYNGDGTTYRIWGKRVPRSCSVNTCLTQVVANISPEDHAREPSVAWDAIKNRYLVVFDIYDGPAESANPNGVLWGCIIAGVVRSQGTIISSITKPQYSDLAYNPASEEFLFVWLENQTSIKTERHSSSIYPDCINNVSSFTIKSSSPGWTLSHPSVTTNQQNRYLVGWEEIPGAGIPGQTPFIKGMELTQSLQWVNDFQLSSGGSGSSLPVFVANNAHQEWLAAWQQALPAGDTILFASWQIGSVPGAANQMGIAAWDNWNARRPAIAAGKNLPLVIYEGRENNPDVYQHIYGHMLFDSVLFMPLVVRQ